MTDKDFFIETIADELPRFIRVFDALPMDRIDHTHHERSKTAAQLIVQMADETTTFMTFLRTGKVDWAAHQDIPVDKEHIKKLFADSLTEAADYAAEMSADDWNSDAVATAGEHEAWKTTKGKMAWGLLLDLIHHRGQLSTYIRPMGGKVPSIYGPSGDSAE